MLVGKQIPFSINRNDVRPLFNQVVDGFREAIVSGYYVSGDKIPSSRDLCPILGVSRIVTQAALEQLASEGLVVSRPRIGSVVRDCNAKQWKGRVLFVVPETNGSYFINVLIGTAREILMSEGWLFHQVTLGCDAQRRHDLSRLDVALRVSTDLVLTLWDRADILKRLSESGVPFVTISEHPCPVVGVSGRIRYPHRSFVPPLVRDCVAAGVKRVEQVGFMRSTYNAAPALRRAGIKVKETVIPPDRDWMSTYMDIKRPVMEAFGRRLAKGVRGANLPDLFYFDDDIVASAALMALVYHGVKIPEDVSVVAFSNVGFGPCFPVPLARVEMDPFLAGRTVARAALSFLAGDGIPPDATIQPEYVRGDSFPVLQRNLERVKGT